MVTNRLLLWHLKRVFTLYTYLLTYGIRAHRQIAKIDAWFVGCRDIFAFEAIAAKAHKRDPATDAPPLIHFVGGSSYGAFTDLAEMRTWTQGLIQGLALHTAIVALHLGMNGRCDFHILSPNLLSDGRALYNANLREKARALARELTARLNEQRLRQGLLPIGNLTPEGEVFFLDPRLELVAPPPIAHGSRTVAVDGVAPQAEPAKPAAPRTPLPAVEPHSDEPNHPSGDNARSLPAETPATPNCPVDPAPPESTFIPQPKPTAALQPSTPAATSDPLPTPLERPRSSPSTPIATVATPAAPAPGERLGDDQSQAHPPVGNVQPHPKHPETTTATSATAPAAPTPQETRPAGVTGSDLARTRECDLASLAAAARAREEREQAEAKKRQDDAEETKRRLGRECDRFRQLLQQLKLINAEAESFVEKLHARLDCLRKANAANSSPDAQSVQLLQASHRFLGDAAAQNAIGTAMTEEGTATSESEAPATPEAEALGALKKRCRAAGRLAQGARAELSQTLEVFTSVCERRRIEFEEDERRQRDLERT